jgi:hypothetical protein
MSATVPGVNWYAHDASAALAQDGRVVGVRDLDAVAFGGNSRMQSVGA